MMAASFQHPEAERERIRDLSRYYCTVDRPAVRLEAAADEVRAAREHRENHAGTCGEPPGPEVHLSSDITLTALAQLAVLRFGCTRSFISIIDGVNQYIIAEATKSISLRDKHQHDPGDALYLGVRTLDLIWGVCPHSVGLFTGQDPSRVIDTPNITARTSHFIVRDFTREDFFKDRPYITGWPHFRFYAEVPLYSPAGHVLGTFCVIDDQPRDTFGDRELAGLREVADAVAQHLEHVRISHSHRRAESLVKGLTSFVKEHSTFDSADVPVPVPSSNATLPPSIPPALDQLARLDEATPPHDPLLPLPSVGSEATGELTSLFSAVTCSERTATSTSVNAPAPRVAPVNPVVEPPLCDGSETRESSVVVSDHTEFPAIAVMEHEARSESLARIFARASVTLRDSMDLHGVLFLDASRCNAGVVRPGQAGSWEPLPTTANPEFLADPYPSPIDLPGVGSLSNVSEQPCEVLGQAQSASAPSQHAPGPVTEALLDQMIARFPHGQCINLQADPVASEDAEADDPGMRDICRRLRQSLPDAYCVLFYPLWDWNRSRWLAGTLVWTEASDRALGLEELHYFKVFGDSIISEVARVEWASTQKSKSDFISSVSHELRSPLHGILASAELLQTTPLQASQSHWMNMVKSCGLTLLDTLNHLLDFAKINNLTTTTTTTTTTTDDPSPDPAKPSVTNLLTVFDLDDLIEEVTDVQYTGQRLAQTVAPLTGRQPSAPHTNGELTVVVRVQDRHAWKVHSVAGAWRRIVMNLLGNSLKWTKSGFIEVSLSKAHRASDPHAVLAHLSVTDTGSGIAPDFLKHRLFSPFTQEDALSEGLGLGFSIVRQLVASLDGHIDVRSEVGVGTQVDIYIPVHTSPDLARHPFRRSIGDELAAPLHPMTACLIGFDGYPTPRETPTGILPAESKRKLAIRSSLTSVLAHQPGWTLSLAETLDKAHGDVAVIEEDDLGVLLREQLSTGVVELGDFRFFIVLDKDDSAPSGGTSPPNVVRVSQPFGPQKFYQAIERVQALQREVPLRRPPPRPSPLPLQSSQPTSPTYFAGTPLVSPTTLAAETPVGTSHPPCKAPKDIHVLLVDDNNINLKILATFVRKIGCSYDTATNGLIALNTYKAAPRRHDIILMDISMPVMDGITSTDHIRRYEKKNGLIPTRVIAVTGLGSADCQKQALAAGVDEYLVKPVSLHGLRKVMRIT
ncbi:two-component sensor protein histidine protein kinase [Aspergillus ellipticus CBS 707.79]|uniref:histidine kinase n=1 Tax=Aspergillus ellipticus CBS 707.79 TaxID=1448320 RepID=A0A319D286_9EURO|nr:two-component sensor protein histidine protein kinase [Aspergillus ellipticus CBS 707.79]